MVLKDELAFNKLKEMILDRTGVDCRNYKDNYLRRRIELRMKARRIGSSYYDYCTFLKKNPDEYKTLLDGITINVTEFFRDPETFAVFKGEVLPQLISEKIKCKRAMVRIWSAGCSIGEEPYTIGIILHEHLGAKLKDFIISIHATDIDRKALNAARTGAYEAQALINISTSLRSKYFHLNENGKYRIKDEVKRLVRFRQHDLFSDKKFSHFDVIFCRNVMIYFGKDFQNRLLFDFYNALNLGGYLILGKTETMPREAKDLFECVNTRERIYRKTVTNAN